MVERYLQKLLPGSEFEIPQNEVTARANFFKEELMKEGSKFHDLAIDFPVILSISSLIIENFGYQYFNLPGINKSPLIIDDMDAEPSVYEERGYAKLKYLNGHGLINLKRPDKQLLDFLDKIDLFSSGIGVVTNNEVIEPYTVRQVIRKNVRIKVDNLSIELPKSLNKAFFSQLRDLLEQYCFEALDLIPSEKAKKRPPLQKFIKLSINELMPLIKDAGFAVSSAATSGNQRFIAGLVFVQMKLLRNRTDYLAKPYKKSKPESSKNKSVKRFIDKKRKTLKPSNYYSYLTKTVWNYTER